MLALIPPFFLDCVVAIGVLTMGANGVPETQWTGSGFLYGDFVREHEPSLKEFRVYLVTNRHVLENQKQVQLRFNPTETKTAQEFPLPARADGSLDWTAHPDPNIDVAVVRINTQFLDARKINYNYFHSDSHAANIEKAKELGVSEGDGVFALGFPLGLVGGERNHVIVRQGGNRENPRRACTLDERILSRCSSISG